MLKNSGLLGHVRCVGAWLRGGCRLAAQILGYDGGAMQSKDEHLDVRARAAQKQASREQDEHDLRTGRKSAEQLRRENELLAPFARTARVDLAASRSLG
jgi:hypothetical protein